MIRLLSEIHWGAWGHILFFLTIDAENPTLFVYEIGIVCGIYLADKIWKFSTF